MPNVKVSDHHFQQLCTPYMLSNSNIVDEEGVVTSLRQNMLLRTQRTACTLPCSLSLDSNLAQSIPPVPGLHCHQSLLSDSRPQAFAQLDNTKAEHLKHTMAAPAFDLQARLRTTTWSPSWRPCWAGTPCCRRQPLGPCGASSLRAGTRPLMPSWSVD